MMSVTSQQCTVVPLRGVRIPVGAGRRAFWARELARIPGSEAGPWMVLVTARADLAQLWHRELAAYLAPTPVGRLGAGRGDDPSQVAVLVATARSASTRLPAPWSPVF